jgi:predicted amidohydrolase YtcJ
MVGFGRHPHEEVLMNHNRREFIGLAGAGVAGIVSETMLEAETQDADLVVFNAKVYTVDSNVPKAEAFAVKNGRFVAVGSNRNIRALIAKGTQTFDAKQMTIVPGFIDCHNHAPGDVLLYEVIVGDPYVVEFVTIASIVDKLRAKARDTPPGNMGGRLFLRRHQGERQSPDPYS